MASSDVVLSLIIILGLGSINIWFLGRIELNQPLEEASAHLRTAASLARKTAVIFMEDTDDRVEVPFIEAASAFSTRESPYKATTGESRRETETATGRDLRCGDGWGGRKCDSSGAFPCCSAAGWCGSTPLHCACDGCIDYRHSVTEDMGCSEDRDDTIMITGPRGQRFKRLNSTALAGANALWCYSSNCERDHRWFPLEAAIHHCSNLNTRCMGVQCTRYAEGDRCYVKETAKPQRKATGNGGDVFSYLKCPSESSHMMPRSIVQPQYNKTGTSEKCGRAVTLEQVFNPQLTTALYEGQPRDPDCDYIDTNYYDNFFTGAYRLCDGATTKFYCTISNNPFHPVAADNANLCWGQNLQLKPKLAQKSFRLKNRAWMSGSPDAYFTYQPGFLSGQCEKRASNIDYENLFTGNYVRDFVESADWSGVSEPTARVLEGPTVLTWRESNGKREDKNLWHSYMHYLNVYQALMVFGIKPGPDVRVIFLDNNVPVWHTELVTALAGKVLTLSDIRDDALLLKGPVVVAPSMHNTPFQATHYEVAIRLEHLSVEASTVQAFGCTHPLTAPIGLVYTILSHYRLLDTPVEIGTLRVLFLARRGHVTRQVQNEAELISMLERSAHVSVSAIDIATLSLRDQIATVAHSDILVTSHGAGATYVTFLPKYGGYLELWHDRQANDNECPIWCLFNHLALWSGIRHVDNWNPPQSYGFGSRAFPVDVETLRPQYTRMVENVRKSKQLFINDLCA